MKANRVKPAINARFSEILLKLIKKGNISLCLRNSEVCISYQNGLKISPKQKFILEHQDIQFSVNFQLIFVILRHKYAFHLVFYVSEYVTNCQNKA